MDSCVPASPAKGALSQLRVLVLGYVVRGPLGGLAWHHLQYVMGLAELGHDVYFLEDSDDYPSCYNPATNRTTSDPAYGLEFARRAFAAVGLADRWCYYDGHEDRWHGPAAPRIHEVCASAELLLNLSGVNPLRAWMLQVPRRVLVDTDPAFTQIRHLTVSKLRLLASSHHAFFSFGENIGSPGCSIPDDGFPWQPTRQPVVTGVWPVTPAPADGKFTSVMQWDSYAPAVYQGIRYGMKSASFAPYAKLPERVGRIFELAAGGSERPDSELEQNGWTVLDPRVPTADIWTYQRYIQSSRGEFGIAKHGYVASRSGWFSERSTAYMASGRPVIVQETGFSDWLPTGQGVLPFRDPEETVAAIEEIQCRYDPHCRAARELVEEYFSAPRVLTSLIERAWSETPCGVGSPNRCHRAGSRE